MYQAHQLYVHINQIHQLYTHKSVTSTIIIFDYRQISDSTICTYISGASTIYMYQTHQLYVYIIHISFKQMSLYAYIPHKHQLYHTSTICTYTTHINYMHIYHTHQLHTYITHIHISDTSTI